MHTYLFIDINLFIKYGDHQTTSKQQNKYIGLCINMHVHIYINTHLSHIFIDIYLFRYT